MIEIGSDMRISLSTLLGKDNALEVGVYLSTGRDCLELIIRSLKIIKDDVIMMPSYLCPEMIKPFTKKGIIIRYYKVNKDLTISSQDFLGEISKGDVKAAIIINYFGRQDPQVKDVREACQKNKVLLIEDCCQSTLSKKPMIGEIAFYNYRKTLPVPEGAMIKGLENQAIVTNITPEHKRFVRTRLIAGLLKNIKSLKFLWRGLFIKAEKELVNNYERPAPMSKVSKRIISSLDLQESFNKRRENYSVLLDAFREDQNIKPLMPELLFDEEVMPFSFPVIISDYDGYSRDYIREKLMKKKIYCPVHWELPNEVSKDLFPESHWISKHIISLPIDQRYDHKDMERIIREVRI